MALVNLQFIQYNNYFNKILRKPANPFLVTSYNSYPVKKTIISVAFNENDGVTTYQVVDKDIDDVGDYLLVHDGEDIFSHWFVTEAKRNRLGQCMVTLQRDLLVDYYETIKSAPAFIERGMLSNDDPMIFNDEGLTYNQIKQDEELLYDDTKCGWIIGYLSKSSYGQDTDITADVTFTNDPSSSIPEYDSWSNVPEDVTNLINGITSYKAIQDSSIIMFLKDIGFISYNQTQAFYIDQLGGTIINDVKLAEDCNYNSRNNLVGTKHALRSINLKQVNNESDGNTIGSAAQVIRTMLDNNMASIKSQLGLNDASVLSVIEAYGETKIKVAGTTYLLKRKTTEEELAIDLSGHTVRTNIVNGLDELLGTSFFKFVNANGSNLTTLNNADIYVGGKSNVITLEAEPAGETAKVTIPSVRQKTVDAQYDMFAIPFGDIFFYLGSRQTSNRRKLNKEASLAIAQAIAVNASASLYDLQILPYCPSQDLVHKSITSSGLVKYISVSDGRECSLIKNGNDAVQSFVLWCSHSSFNLSIGYQIPKSNDAKSQKTLDKYRLSGGNYASMFDFTPDMNGGVYSFNVYCDYRPYKPFVKVNPNFSYLYGQDFKDPLGLILSGDFSLTIMQNQWQNYLLNNKNYEAMFDRQIQSVELQNDIAYQQSIFGAVSGAFSGTATGAIAGGMKGGVVGAIAGAVVGGVASGVGGGIDVANQDTLRGDSLNLQKQMHAYQLDNIKALPNTIQKLTSLVQINKIIPVLEHYSCTQQERQYFADYIKYSGMTVGRIDKIENFESNGGFIQGRFIRLEGLSEDYHLANALNTTFQAGFYFEEV